MKKLLCFSILLLAPPLMAAKPMPGNFYTQGSQTEKKIALSFDDGPGPSTEEFLDLLDRYNVKTTFFMLGHEVKRRVPIAKMVVSRGHEVGNHSTQHTNWYKRFEVLEFRDKTQALHLAKAELKEDLMKTQKIIDEKTGRLPVLCRMPHGYNRPWIHEVAKEVGLVLVNWTFGADWTKKPEEELEQGYVKAIRPGAILLFHDGGSKRQKTLRLAESVIKAAHEKGYEIVPVGELIGLDFHPLNKKSE